MKRACFLIMFAFVLSSCGLKVNAVISGSDQEQNNLASGNNRGTGQTGSQNSGPGGPGGTNVGSNVGPSAVPSAGVLSSAMFPNETEGVTKNQITLCTHVPITGAAPISRSDKRFGQFYFDYVNNELGGIYGRNVRFLAYDDGYYPTGALAAVDKCKRAGSFIYLGAAGTDQIVAVAKFAEREHIPYIHGPTSDKDLKGLHYNVFDGPTYEYQSRLLADYLVHKYGTQKRYGMVRINSPYFDSGHDAYVDELRKFHVELVVDRVVQKDEKQFQNLYYDLVTKNVDIVNNFTTPSLWLAMIPARPASYSPLWTAVSPVASYNLIATGLGGQGVRMEVFGHFNPACHCTTYDSDLDPSTPYYNDEREFLRIFRKYSPEQKPYPDDFDYAAYLSVKKLHRLLLALGPDPTRTKLFALLANRVETKKAAFPGCPPDFTRIPGSRRGGWFVNVFELDGKRWKQTATCIDHA